MGKVCQGGGHKFRARSLHYDRVLYGGAWCSGVLVMELAARHLSGFSNFEMAVRLLEVSCAPALRNAHYTRLKFGHFSVCMDIYYVTEFISIYHVIYLYTFCILYFVSSNNVKPETRLYTSFVWCEAVVVYRAVHYCLCWSEKLQERFCDTELWLSQSGPDTQCVDVARVKVDPIIDFA
jgi:hypothetical protein